MPHTHLEPEVRRDPAHSSGPRHAAAAARPAPADAPEGDGGRLLAGLRYHWFTIAVGGSIVAAALAAAAWATLPQRYTATALLHVAATPQRLINPVGGGGYQQADFGIYLKTQSEYVKSQFVLKNALADKAVAGLPVVRAQADPIKWLDEELTVTNSAGSQLVAISLSADKPDDAKALVSAVRSAYIREIVEKERDKVKDSLTQLEAVQSEKQQELKRLNRRRAELDSPGSAAALAERQFQLQAERVRRQSVDDQLAQVRVGLAAWTIGLERMKTPAAAPTGESAEVLQAEFEAAVEGDATYRGLGARAERLQAKIDYYRQHYGERRQAELGGVIDDLARLRADMDRYRATAKRAFLEARLARRGGGTGDDRAREVANAEREIDMLRARERGLMDQVARLGPGPLPEAAPTRPPELDEVDISIKQAEHILNQATGQHQVVRLELQSPSRVSELPLTDAVQKDMKKRLMMAGMAGVLGFALVGGLAMLVEARAARVYGRADLAARLGLPLLGAVPPCPDAGAARSAATLRQAERFEESIDKVRAVAIQSFLRGRPGKVVLVTSAAEGEGKTLFATHFAASLMRAERKTLLIDGNLRQPRVHEAFGLPNKPGLCEVLRGEAGVSEVVGRAGPDGPWFIPAGGWDARVKEELAKDKFRKLLERLAGEYDQIVIDTHAALAVADTLLMSQHADAVVVTAQRHRSRLPGVEEAVQKLLTVGASHIGLVLTGDADAAGGVATPTAEPPAAA